MSKQLWCAAIAALVLLSALCGAAIAAFDPCDPIRTPQVFDDGSCTPVNTSLHASWIPDPDYPGDYIVSYQYAIGTAPEGTNVVGWTDVGTVTQVTRTGLNLSTEYTYYVSVRYKAREGQALDCWSAVASTDGIKYVTWYRTYGENDLGQATVVNANGTSCRYTYDERWRLRQVKDMEPDGEGITGAVLNYTVDGVGNRTEMWFNYNTADKHVFVYDDINRLWKVNYYNDTEDEIQFVYDWVGNRTKVDLSANDWEFFYDDADRLTSRTNPSVSYTYHGTGSMEAADGTTDYTYTYDPRELLSTVTYQGE